MRTKMPLVHAAQPKQLMATMHRWKFSALAAAAAVSVGLYASDASALALGRISVQSALGEPLRAEIELPQITPAEANSLKAQIASPETFRAQGMEYSPAVNGLQVQIDRRADGLSVLRLSSSRPVNEPFVDLVLNASWDSGQIVRSYTMLFDPPSMRRAPAAVTAPAQITAKPPVAAPSNAQVETAPRQQTARPMATAQPVSAAASSETGVTVRPGDTAGRLANAHRPSGVSLDQMLVAMMRSNPDAFVGGNMNRLKAGAVLQMPDTATAQSVPTSEARQIVATQSRDFNEFRRKLAGSVPSTTIEASSRSASGKVQTQVEDKRPATAAPDKLTLSKGAVQGQKTVDDKLAQDKQADEQAARMAELSRNISELNKIGGTAPAPAGGAAPPSAPGVAVASGAPAAAVTATPAAEAPTVAATPASAPAATIPAEPTAPPATESAAPAAEPAPAAPPPPPKPAAAAPASMPEEPSFIDSLMEDPMIPMAGGGLLLALLGWGAYRIAKRRRNAATAGVDSTFMESKLQPDSFFGASGGQRVDTANSDMTTGSSLAYSPSQLDAGGDVDPVAEADVYLAYGRDLQAEEILKEAVRHNPARTSIHVKLAEIYAKRQDRKALEAIASEVFQLTQASGPDWARVIELGRELDPANPLYQPGGRPGMSAAADTAPSPLGGLSSTQTTALAAAMAPLPPDLDLDLDLSPDALTEAPPATPSAFATATAMAASAATLAASHEPSPVLPEPEATPLPAVAEMSAEEPQAFAAAPTPELDLNALELPDWDAPPPAAQAPATPPEAQASPQMPELDFPLDGLELLDSGIAPLTPVAAKASTPAPEADLDFDLGDLSLDLGAPKVSAAPPTLPSAPADEPSDPLGTKLALAEEFHAIGDSDGARTLIEEVIAEASGPLKARAQRLLADLG